MSTPTSTSTLPGPVMVASGCGGTGRELAAYADLVGLDFVTRSITLDPRSGGPAPRIVETPSGLVNAIGLQNPGISGFIRKYPPIWESWEVPAIVNISAESVEDFAMMARRLDDVPGVAALEVNISCPNISAGGYCFGWDPVMSADVTRAVREATTLPIIVKLSPGAVDMVEIAQAVEDSGADAVSLINTLVGMTIDTHTRRPVLANVTGGLSGPAMRPVAVRMVYQVAQAVRIPVVGLGGISTLDDALQFFLAGASAIQVGTAVFSEPSVLMRLIDDLAAWMTRNGVKRLSEIVGSANPRFGAHISLVDAFADEIAQG